MLPKMKNIRYVRIGVTVKTALNTNPVGVKNEIELRNPKIFSIIG